MTIWELIKEMETLKEEILELISQKRFVVQPSEKERYEQEITRKEEKLFEIVNILKEVRVDC